MPDTSPPWKFKTLLSSNLGSSSPNSVKFGISPGSISGNGGSLEGVFKGGLTIESFSTFLRKLVKTSGMRLTEKGKSSI